MMDRTEPAGMTSDRHIIGWISEDYRRPLFTHQRREIGVFESITTQDEMATEMP